MISRAKNGRSGCAPSRVGSGPLAAAAWRRRSHVACGGRRRASWSCIRLRVPSSLLLSHVHGSVGGVGVVSGRAALQHCAGTAHTTWLRCTRGTALALAGVFSVLSMVPMLFQHYTRALLCVLSVHYSHSRSCTVGCTTWCCLALVDFAVCMELVHSHVHGTRPPA